MWLLSFIPDWIIHFVALASLAILLISFLVGALIPLSYRIAVQLLALILVAGSIWLEGGIANQAIWQQKVLKQQVEIAQLEATSQQVTVKTITKYIDRVKIVKEKARVIVKEIPKYITKEHDSQCDIPNAAIVLHDAAAKNELPDAARLADEGTSDVTLSQLLDTTALNYGTFYEVREQLKALQDWIREQKKLNP
jgi:hypothetical protein